jgi:hypothetical protein
MSQDELLDLPFDQYQRYRITVEIIQILKKKKGTGRLRILDVGGCANSRNGKGYFLPLSGFLPDEDLTVVDIVEFKDPIYVKGNGRDIPFTSGAFDVVVCNDVLEHIPPSNRKGFIENLVRVSESYLILANPYKTLLNEQAENDLFYFVQERLGSVHRQLKEHIDFGLPRKEEIEDILRESGATFFSFPSGDVYRWFLMMIIKHYLMGLPESQLLHRKIDRLYNQNLWNEMGIPEAYRCFFIILKGVPHVEGTIRHIREEIRHLRRKGGKEIQPSGQETVFHSILDMVWAYHPMIEGLAQRYQEMLKQMDDNVKQLDETTKQLEALREQHAQLAEFYRTLDASPIYKTYRFLKRILRLR